MKKIFLLLVTLSFIFASCGTEEDDLEFQKLTDMYHFKCITYHLEENDSIQTREYWHEYVLARNWTEQPMNVVFHPYQNEQDYSVFHGLENIPYIISQEEPIRVNIPMRINFGNSVITSSEKYNLFTKEIFPSNHVSRTSSSTILPPLCGIKVKHNEVTELLNITYKAIFVGEKYGNEITIKGKWEGRYHLGCLTSMETIYNLESANQ